MRFYVYAFLCLRDSMSMRLGFLRRYLDVNMLLQHLFPAAHSSHPTEVAFKLDFTACGVPVADDRYQSTLDTRLSVPGCPLPVWTSSRAMEQALGLDIRRTNRLAAVLQRCKHQSLSMLPICQR